MAITLTQASGISLLDHRLGLATGQAYCIIYDAGDNPLTGNWNLNATPFGAAADDPGNNRAIATANALATNVPVILGGTAAKYKVFNGSDTELWEGTVSTTGAGTGDMQFDNIVWTTATILNMSSWTEYENYIGP